MSADVWITVGELCAATALIKAFGPLMSGASTREFCSAWPSDTR